MIVIVKNVLRERFFEVLDGNHLIYYATTNQAKCGPSMQCDVVRCVLRENVMYQ